MAFLLLARDLARVSQRFYTNSVGRLDGVGSASKPNLSSFEEAGHEGQPANRRGEERDQSAEVVLEHGAFRDLGCPWIVKTQNERIEGEMIAHNHWPD